MLAFIFGPSVLEKSTSGPKMANDGPSGKRPVVVFLLITDLAGEKTNRR